MLQRWKLILANWINCYFNKASENERNVDIESLLGIISHLRENLNLDESKSSILEANTVEEFLCDKYPEFKFENGTVEATNEEEICLSASLLLFFICVNSKNFDMKNAMCSKLSPEDQETILKFSKCLMECPVISVREVQAAITEACGQDVAAMELPHRFTIAETPPALRSLHSEVRRLQAALDAERFDRNYLQEELSRTHSKLERLRKEKEQYKLDILNLKAKISLCCGEETDSKNAEVAADKSSRLMKQLQQLEDKLEETQSQLDDVVYERDCYKAKMDELKNDRDKWVALSQQENAQVSQLSHELDIERHNVLSLKELVAELRQHNKLNVLDSSALECDDPDASIISLQHNTSICSEACTNIIEVQLSEEKAKVALLNEQIQRLQVQLNDLEQMKQTEKKTLENVVAQRENDIFNLKHRINEEIEEKINIKVHSDNEMTKLNNQINDLEQNLKDSNESSRSIIEKKLEEIQTLQEEKLSLIHSLNNETTKLENIIKGLKSELESERQSRSTMREGYENHIMKLNEKVLNRNNELVELQNSIFEKGETIETLQIELKKEKEAFNEYKNKFQYLEEQKRIVENDLRHKHDEIQNMNIKMQHNITIIEDMKMEIEAMKTSVSSLNENCKTLESVKEQLMDEIRKRDTKIEEMLKDINHVNEVFTKEKEKLMQDMDERNATINSLQIQLHNEIQFKIGLQNDITQLNIAKTRLSEEFEMNNSELSKLKVEIEDKDRTINAMDLYIQEEKKCNDQANLKLQEMTDIINAKENQIQILNDKLEASTKSLQDEIKNSKDCAEVSKNKLLTEIAERETLELQFNLMLKDHSHIERELSLKCHEIFMIQEECKYLTQKLEENKSFMQILERKNAEECKKYIGLNSTFAAEMSVITTKVNQMQNAVIKATEIMECKIMEKESHLHNLGNNLKMIKKTYEETIINFQKMQNENQLLASKLKEEISLKTKLEEDQRHLNKTFESLSSQFKEQIEAKDTEISCLKLEIQSLLKTIGEKAECLNALVEKIYKENQSKSELLRPKETAVKDLQVTALEKATEKFACLQEPPDHNQVDNSSSDNMHSSDESLKTITDLEKIIHDKNRTITTLQTDITYLKSLMAESETRLLDVNKELEVTEENCQQLSNQLKKIVYQKNEEIAELKKQVIKMSVTENRASQIIKVSAKYQAMILKRIAEIKSNTVLKELTNFGNSDNELKRSLAGTITMEDLENFLDTTDRHLKRCSEKQIALQKERDRLIEVNRINASEIINLKKFLTELSVSFQTFSSFKDLYGNKLSRVISVQRTVRREILNLDGRISDATMCKLERGYGAAMQDLSECTMTLERWVERCISRTVSVEKIKQAFTSDSERSSLAAPSFQNTGLEIQLEELEKSFQKLLEEVARAVKGEAAKESQASTVMEVRAEYEDKLNRMKAKMKVLFNEQMALLKNKQREEIGLLERELQKTRDRMEESKRAYESHIKELTKELWNVGEKYLVKNDEAEWLRKKQRSGSLMSLQHVHSSGLVSRQEPPSRRPSDAHSLRSLPVIENPKSKSDGRNLHMSDEEGEVFDNRWLKELSATPRRDKPPGQRLSELKWRNSLCPPHLKSSYPAETQFAPVLDEDDIKAGSLGPAGIKPQRKEVGITAYKKPGPPTPSKQAGRLSATDSELRESLRVEGDPHSQTERKTSTPARFRAFLRFNKNDTNEGTPRTRRLSNIFRKK